MRFIGDLVITDPCYVVRSEDDWQDSEFGVQLAGLGFSHWLTVEGGGMEGKVTDETGAQLGRFCTDSYMITVFPLDELNEYNPAWAEKLGDWCYTIIRGFDGRVEWDGERLVGTGKVSFSAV